jgi:hypothetical protein
MSETVPGLGRGRRTPPPPLPPLGDPGPYERDGGPAEGGERLRARVRCELSPALQRLLDRLAEGDAARLAEVVVQAEQPVQRRRSGMCGRLDVYGAPARRPR